MREKKKSLKLRKFKIASLDAAWLKGGTNSNPCNNTQQVTHTCPTVDGYTCPVTCNPDTRTQPQTQPANPCTCGDSIPDRQDDKGGVGQIPDTTTV